MSVNKFMHPKNIYKTPPDFTQLALNYPEFKEISKVKLNGKVTIDFTNANSIRILTKCLLKKDFQLDVILPENKLVPTLPLRLNYILWIEDLMNAAELKDVRGIDIGCGASCVYPLLAVRMKSWRMIGLEANEDSFKLAEQNVKANNLENSIQILKADDSSDIFANLADEQYTFCMCNPPFYNLDSTESNKNNRTGHRKPPKNGFTGIRNELFTDGGEIKFASKIIEESIGMKTKIRIYTTMLGHKTSVNKLLDVLKTNGIVNYQKTEFCQGNTTRWAIAWTFDDSIKLFKSVVPAKDNNEKYILTQELNSSDISYTAATIKLEYILNILLNLDIKIVKTIENKFKLYEMVAYETTWLNYRRRKRELLKKSQSECDNEKNCELDQVPHPKRVKLETACDIVLKCNLGVRHKEVDGKVMLELNYVAGTAGKNGVHQLMLFISNRFKEHIVCDEMK